MPFVAVPTENCSVREAALRLQDWFTVPPLRSLRLYQPQVERSQDTTPGDISSVVYAHHIESSHSDLTGLGTDPRENEVPPLPARAVSQLAICGSCGLHRVLCGDSTSQEVVARLLRDAKPLLMVTDHLLPARFTKIFVAGPEFQP